MFVTTLLCIGCANPGPPKPPSLHLPALVTDLAAERTGNRVILHWTTPSTTTDGLAVKGAMTAQICRETGPRPGTSAARVSSCAPILRLAVAPGPSEVADTLPANLAADPVALLTYRVQVLNSTDRSAGDSPQAFAAAGAAPQPIDSLNGTPSAQGIVLEWAAPVRLSRDTTLVPMVDQVELTRTDLSVPSIAAKPAKPSRPRPGGQGKPAATQKSGPQSPAEVHLLTAEQPGGTLDATAKFGETYTYTAERIRPVSIGPQNLKIRSGTSAVVTVAFRDTFPPQRPAGLATIPGRGGTALNGNAAPYIDLSWEPNTESDLAGYLVYRQLAQPNGDPQGPPTRLTSSPVTAPAYRDVAVSTGQRYIYWVTAVDASGNESAPSAKAQEAVIPE